MVEIACTEPVEYLVEREFPHIRHLQLAYARGDKDERLLVCIAEVEAAAERYRGNLLKLSPEQLEQLCRQEREKEAELKRMNDELVDNQRFFNPPLTPDYNFYRRLACWTLDEAVALSFGRDPEQVSAEQVKHYASDSDFAQRYLKRLVEVQRAVTAQKLSLPLDPSQFIVWCNSRGIELPAALQVAGVGGVQLPKAPQSRSQETEQESTAPKEHVSFENSSNSGKTRQYNKVCLLLFGLAKLHYGVEFGGIKKPDLKKLLNEFADLGIPIDDETLFKHLHRGSDQAANRVKSERIR